MNQSIEDDCRKIRIVGLPGTGKTTKLIKMVGEFLDNYKMKEIAYCSFTNAAVDEAKSRVQQKFDVNKNQMIWFRTMHSLCNKLNKDLSTRPVNEFDRNMFYEQYWEEEGLGVVEAIIEEQDYVGREIGEDEGIAAISIETMIKDTKNWYFEVDKYVLMNYPEEYMEIKQVKSRMQDLFERLGLEEEDAKDLVAEVNKFRVAWYLHRMKNGIYEFDELILKVLEEEIKLPCKVLIIDEFQDSSYLQNLLIDMWSKFVEVLVIAGDPNQAIYSFSGASPRYINQFEPTSGDDDILLNKSYRLPKQIVDYAKKVIGTQDKWAKTMYSGIDQEGEVKSKMLTEVDFNVEGINSIFVLARTNYYVNEISKILIDQGILVNTPLLNRFYRLYKIAYHLSRGESIKYTDVEFLIKEDEEKQGNVFAQSNKGMLKNWIKDIREGDTRDGERPSKQADASVIISNLGLDRDDRSLKMICWKISRMLPTESMRELMKDLYTDNVTAGELKEKMNQVRVMTIHASKGMEADKIVLCNIASHYERRGDIIDEEEERRVYYVAVTRAKKKLIIANPDLEDTETTQYLPYPKITVDQFTP